LAWRWARWAGAALVVAGLAGAGVWLARGRSAPTPAVPTTPAPTLVIAARLATPTATPGNTQATTPGVSASSTALRPTGTSTITLTPTPQLITYTIEAGNTLSFLSEKYGTTINAIAQASGIEIDSILHVGQVITVPLPAATSIPTRTDTPQPFVEAVDAGALAGDPDFLIYEVEAGDTLSSIADEYEISITRLMQANPLVDPQLLQVGQKVRIPLHPPTATLPPTPRPRPSATAGPPFPAPALLNPSDGEALRGAQDGLPMLVWSAAGLLKDDQWYLVRLWSGKPPAGTFVAEEWTKGTSWRAPADIVPGGAAAPQTFYWSVIVARREGQAGAYVWTALSAQSQIWSFSWRP